jgi:hypothetical protein
VLKSAFTPLLIDRFPVMVVDDDNVLVPVPLKFRLLNVVEFVPPIVWDAPFRLVVPVPQVKLPLLVKLPVKFNVPVEKVTVPVLIVRLFNVAVLVTRFKDWPPTFVKSCPPVMPPTRVIAAVVPMLLAVPKVRAPL